VTPYPFSVSAINRAPFKPFLPGILFSHKLAYV
jgi:hypothetical protein